MKHIDKVIAGNRDAGAMGKYLGIYVYNLFMAFNIAVIFWRRSSKPGSALFDSIRRYLNRYYKDNKHEIVFKTAQLGADAGIIGQ